MIVAIASGKGGTGKTTVAVNLALIAPGGPLLVDCDVEEPNARLFLKPRTAASAPVMVPVPTVDASLCAGCGRCARACQFGAMAMLGPAPTVFPDLCHGCGLCALVCPKGAIQEGERPIGDMEAGNAGPIRWMEGRLAVGQAMPPPLIRRLLAASPASDLAILDCPPGASCPMLTAARHADYVALVTEPTPFGLNDLFLAVDALRAIGRPFGVVINRCGTDDGRLEDYCRNRSITVLARIPNRRQWAEAISKGLLLAREYPEYASLMGGLAEAIVREAGAKP